MIAAVLRVLTAGTRIGPYEIAAQIGAGGMGDVYRATDPNLKRQVAIEIPPDGVAADRERLAPVHREAHVLASLTHPNIAMVRGWEASEGMTALVMELVEGSTFADRVPDQASTTNATPNSAGSRVTAARPMDPVRRAAVVTAAADRAAVRRT